MAIQPATVSFPDQQMISNYIKNHPLNGCIRTLPQGFQKVDLVATAFANRIMPRNEIEKNIREAFANVNQKALEMKSQAQARLEERKANREDTVYHSNLLEKFSKLEECAYYAPQKVYKRFLKDLADRKAFALLDLSDSNASYFFNYLTK